MKKKGLLALLMSFIMLFSSIGTVFAAEDGSAEVPAWAAEDFTYGEEAFELYPAGETGKKITVNAWVITGLSESGTEKIAVNTDMVIPAVDPDGNQVQGVGKDALKGKGITSVVFPKGVKAAYDDTTWETTGKGLTERGNFFIGYAAFRSNSLTTLELPEGVIYVSNYGFAQNQLTSVKFPKTIMWIASGSFYKNSISKVDFPDATDFAFQADMQAFSGNLIQMVKLPSNTEKLNKWVFLQNTGMETITWGTTAENKGGLVYMYMDAEAAGAYMEYKSANSSNVQELILSKFWTAEDYTYAEDGTTVTGLSESGQIKVTIDAWCADDFTYDEAGTTVTGLSDTGKIKIKVEPNIQIPEVSSTGQTITAIGDGTNMQGVFVLAEGTDTTDDTTDDKYYTPASVELPSTLTKIGKWSFALNPSLTYEAEMTSIEFPEGLVEIGQTAFQNSKLTSVSIPDSVTTMGTGTFTGSGDLASVKLSKNVVDIPQSAFASGNVTDMSLKTVVIPEGVQTVGRQAFKGAHIESLTLPSTLREIGQEAFGNHQLTELTIPGSVKTIGKYAFRISQESLEATLTNVVLNEGLESIGQYAFVGNSITEVKLPSTVVLTANNKAADLIFGTASAPADPIVRVIVDDESKVTAYNTEYANNYSHIVVYEAPAELKLTGATLQLENDITVIFRAGVENFGDAYSDLYIDVEHELENGETKTTKVKGSLNADGTAYEFFYTGVEAAQVGDSLVATIYGYDAEGNLVTGDTASPYSVKQYCTDSLAKTDEELAASYTADQIAAYRTLLVDLLNYSAAAQKYFDYKTDAYVNADLTEELKAYASADTVLDSLTDHLDRNYEVLENATATWKGANLLLLSKTTVRLRVAYEGDVSNLKVVANVEGGSEVEITDLEDLGDGNYYVYFDGMTACGFGSPVYFKVMEGDTVISNTLRYSVESYASKKITDETVGEVVPYMMKYGKAAASFVSAE